MSAKYATTETPSGALLWPNGPDVPIEIRIDQRSSNGLYHLTAWRTPQGTVGHSLTMNGQGTPHSLSNLQSKRPFPGKAVPGWQAEVLAFAEGALGTVVEVR